jgi:hypothetical protein
MLSLPFTPEDCIHRCPTAKQLSVSKRAPWQRKKDNLSKLEPIFTVLLIEQRIAGLMEALV